MDYKLIQEQCKENVNVLTRNREAIMKAIENASHEKLVGALNDMKSEISKIAEKNVKTALKIKYENKLNVKSYFQKISGRMRYIVNRIVRANMNKESNIAPQTLLEVLELAGRLEKLNKSLCFMAEMSKKRR